MPEPHQEQPGYNRTDATPRTSGDGGVCGGYGDAWAVVGAAGGGPGGTEMRPHKRQTYRNWPHLDTENTMLVTQSHAILNE